MTEQSHMPPEAKPMKPMHTAGPDWYERRNELQGGFVFRTVDGSIVKLDHRVAGDGTKWVVADWQNGWAHYENQIEPGDLCGEPFDDSPAAIARAEAR